MHPRLGISAGLALIATSLALSAAPALALQVGVTTAFRAESGGEEPNPATVSYTFTITDPDGVDNDVRIEPAKRAGSAYFDAIRISDAGSIITADSRCVPQSDGAVLCSAPPIGIERWDTRVNGTIELAGGDDTLKMGLDADSPWASETNQYWTANGGAGDDRISASSSRPNDLSVQWIGGLGADAADGNAVTVRYEDRNMPLQITIGEGADDGEVGEGDDIGPRVAGVIGGSGDDMIRRTTATPRADLAFGFAPGRQTLLSGGPGDDTLSTDGYAIRASDGAGTNVLRGGPMDDSLSGAGNDRLDAGAGNDQLHLVGGGVALGGEGDDGISAQPSAGAKVLDGGPGQDSLYYDGSVSVSLDDVANDGGRGGKDNVLGVENARIRKGTLIGSDRAEALTASEGSVFGLGGDDTLYGGGVIDGGTGRDAIWPTKGAAVRAKDGQPDTIKCLLTPVKQLAVDRGDSVVGCYARAEVRSAKASGRYAFRVVVLCPEGATTCTGRASLKDRQGLVVASGRFDQIRSGHTKAVTLKRLRRAHWVQAVAVTQSPFDPSEFTGHRSLDVRST